MKFPTAGGVEAATNGVNRNMRVFLKLIAAGVALATAGTAMAQVYVQPHVRSNGTYVQGHYRSAPNSSAYDNYSTRGNVNPYTGQAGTRNPTPSYGTSRTPSTRSTLCAQGYSGYC